MKNTIKAIRIIPLLLIVFVFFGIHYKEVKAEIILSQFGDNEVTDLFGPYHGGPNQLPIQYLGSTTAGIINSISIKIQKNSGANGHIYTAIQNFPLGGAGCTGTGFWYSEGITITDTTLQTITLTGSTTAGTLLNDELDPDCNYRIIIYTIGNLL